MGRRFPLTQGNDKKTIYKILCKMGIFNEKTYKIYTTVFKNWLNVACVGLAS